MKAIPILNFRKSLACLFLCPALALTTQNANAITVSLTSGTNSGPWTLDAGGNTFNGPNNANASIDGVISGTGDLLIQGNSSNNSVVFIDLNVAHSYNGNTEVRSSNARAGIRMGVNNALPTSTVLSLSSTNQGSGRPVWFDLNGFSQQVAGLGGTVSTSYNAIVNGNAAQAGTLVVANGTDFTYTQFLGPDNAHGNVTSVTTGIPDGAGNNFSLVKSGVGTLTLTRLNSYNGDTVINAGTLSIQNAYLADEAAIRMFGTGVLDLDFAGTDTVGALFFDDAPQEEGTWGAIGSGAQFQSTFFTGTGLLQVVPEPSAFAMFGLGLLGFVLRRRK